MSMRSNLKTAARAPRGGKKTKVARTHILDGLADYLQKQNIQIRTLDQLAPKHVADWIAADKESGIGKRTLQNRATAVRTALRGAGLDRKASAMPSNKALGIDGASRKGTRRAITKEEFAERAARVADPGVRLGLEIQLKLALRAQEAVMGGRLEVLQRWERELSQGDTVRVLEGTKTKKPRQTKVVDREAALQAIVAARQFAENNGGWLIAGTNLETAMNRYSNQVRRGGFVGQLSPHSLRYAGAQASIDRYESEGLSQREALACTSLDLGHGEGRGRWVKHVYDQRNRS